MRNKYTANFYIKKFSAIPRRLWRCDGYYGKPGQPKCALGHCGVSDTCQSTEQSNGLYVVLADATVTLRGTIDDITKALALLSKV